MSKLHKRARARSFKVIYLKKNKKYTIILRNNREIVCVFKYGFLSYKCAYEIIETYQIHYIIISPL